MKAMILAAGFGKRMGELTKHCPKPLLEINGKALIQYHIEHLAKAGIKAIVINVCYLADTIMDYLGDGEQFGVNIHYSVEKDEPLGTAGGIVKALPLLGASPFMLVNSDVYTDYPFQSLIDKPIDHAHLVLVPNPAERPTGDFALVDNILSLSAQPKYTYSGIAVYHPHLFQELACSYHHLPDILRPKINAGLVSGEIYAGLWHDVGTPERLQLAACY